MAPGMHLDTCHWYPPSLGHDHHLQVDAAVSGSLFSGRAPARSRAAAAANDAFIVTSFKGGKAKKGGPPSSPKRDREECNSDGICSCTEGHHCIQTFPPGAPRPLRKLDIDPDNVQNILAQPAGFVMGCPATRSGHDLVSRNRYNKLNEECVAKKCLCVLNNDPDEGKSTEIIKIPSVTGEPKTLLPRFPMPNLDDQFVNQVMKKKNDGTAVSPEPLYFDAMLWQQQFQQKYKKNMQKIMDYMMDKMKKLEKDIDKTYKEWEKDSEPDAKPGQEPSAKQKKHDKKQAELEDRAAETFEQFHDFQLTCSKMEDTAQRFKMADYGEAEGLNCHLDPEEKKEAFKAMDRLTELIQAKAGNLPEPTKSASIIDLWTAGPLAALAGVSSFRQDSRFPQQRSGQMSLERVHLKSSALQRASDFLTVVDRPLERRISHDAARAP